MDQHFIVYIVLLLVFAKLLEKPAEKARLSPIVAHIAAGVILGPHILRWVKPVPELEATSYLGLLLLMFYTGMTTNFSELRRLSKWIVAVGVSGVVSTFAMTFGTLLAIGYPTTKAFIIAILLSNTATETVAAVVAGCRSDLVRSIAVGASVVDDIIAVIVLGVVTSSFLGESTVSVFYSFTVSVAVLISVIALSEFLVKNPRILYHRIASNQVVFASASMIAMSGLALLVRFVGLNELIGAYLAGLIIGRGRESHDPLLITETAIVDFLDQLRIFLESLALPLFFTYVGLLLAPADTKPMLFAVLLATATLGKVVGCGTITYLAIRNSSVALSVGSAMVGRGVLETALLKILLDAGLINVTDYTTILLVAITTIILTPLLHGVASRHLGE